MAGIPFEFGEFDGERRERFSAVVAFLADRLLSSRKYTEPRKGEVHTSVPTV